MKVIFSILAILLFSIPSWAAEKYVDNNGAATWANCGNPAKSGTAACSLGTALASATSGDTVWMRAGTYTTKFVPANSGSSGAGNMIFYNNYGSETVVVTPTSGDSSNISVDYIHVTGLKFDNSPRYGIYNLGNYNVYTNVTADYGLHAEAGTIYFAAGSYNKLLNSSIRRWNVMQLAADAFVVGNSHYNVIQGNDFSWPGHAGVQVIQSGHHNIVRGNTFHYIGDSSFMHSQCNFTPSSDDCRTLVEGNIFQDAGRDSGGSSIHGAITNNIIRRNKFENRNLPTGPTWVGHFTLFTGKGYPVTGNRIYHNTVYDDPSSIWAMINLSKSGTGGHPFEKTRFKNNIFYNAGNRIIREECAGSTITCDYYSVIPDVIFDSNLISHTSVGQDIARIETAHQVFTDYTLSELQATYPATFLNNIEGDPLFNDSANYNFTLQDTSPAIDTGTWLTTVVSASGTSTQVQLDDSSYFFDGWGIAGETGDLIKTATGVTATITNVNSGTSEITVSPAISWVQNEGVALDYAGNAPDMGYVESGVTTAPTVSAAVGLAAGGSPTESGTTGIFTFSVDSGGSVSVEWVLAGTGTWGTDVEMAGVSMIISPSISGVTYLTPIDDTDAESTESFGMNLVLPAGANYTLLSPSGVTLWMPDDDPATVSISNVGSPSGGPTESGTTGQVTFSVDSGGSVSVEWVLSGSGTWGTDVEMSGTSMIISPSISGVTYLTPIADALIEPAETFGYNLILPSGATYQLATLTGVTFTLPNEVVLWSGTITFDNGPGEISFGPGGVGVMQ